MTTISAGKTFGSPCPKVATNAQPKGDSKFYYIPIQLNDQFEYNKFYYHSFANQTPPTPLFATISPRSLGTKQVLPQQKKQQKSKAPR